MKVATWRGGSRFTADEAPEPVAGPGQVVVDVAAAGICGTDVHATQGLFPWTPPMVLGHEYSGVVREVGRGVSRRLIGRAVACGPSFGCGTCLPCRNGRISQCAKATRVGGFAERAALPLDCVHPLPRGLDPVTAALTEPASCCLSGLEMFRMPRNATVVVMGGGIMGLLTMVLARRRAPDASSCPIRSRSGVRSRASSPPVWWWIPPARASTDRVLELTGGRGGGGRLRVGGQAGAGREAFAMVKPTGVLQLVGVNPKGSRMPMDLFDIHFREIRIHGAYGRGTAFRRALALLPKLGVKRLIGARFPLARIEEAFAHAAAGRGAKTVITPA